MAVFFSPFADESTCGWLYRLAHSNAADINDFKKLTVEGKTLYDSLIEYKVAHLQKLNEPELAFPSFVRPDLNSEHVNHFKARYCSYCMGKDEMPYFRSTWSIQWITHCLKHNTSLIDSCIHCGTSISYWVRDWEARWGVCSKCNSPCKDTRPPKPHKVFVKKVKPHITMLRSLYDNPNYKGNDLTIRVQYLKVLLTAGYEEETKCRFATLEGFGINPYSYICCGNKSSKNNHKLQDDAAYALAYEVTLNHDSDLIINELELAYQRKIINESPTLNQGNRIKIPVNILR